MFRQTLADLAKTGIKGNTRNPRTLPRVGMGPRGRVKQRGLKVLPGDTVKENDWMVAQTGIRAAYYPGQNCRVNIYTAFKNLFPAGRNLSILDVFRIIFKQF